MNSVTGEDLACTDEIKVYEDEGEEDDQVKSSENLTEDKVGLVIESEGQVPRLFDLFGRNGSSLFKMPWPTDPRFASYFLPGYPAAIAAVMAAANNMRSPSTASPSPSGAFGTSRFTDPQGFLGGIGAVKVPTSTEITPTPNYYPGSSPSSSIWGGGREMVNLVGTSTTSGNFLSPKISSTSAVPSCGMEPPSAVFNRDTFRSSADAPQTFSGSRLSHFIPNSFNPFMPFYHNPLRHPSATSATSVSLGDTVRSPAEPINCKAESDIGLVSSARSKPPRETAIKTEFPTIPPSTNSTDWKSGMSGYPKSSKDWKKTLSAPSGSSGGSTNGGLLETGPSSSLYAAAACAAAVVAAVASWNSPTSPAVPSALSTIAAAGGAVEGVSGASLAHQTPLPSVTTALSTGNGNHQSAFGATKKIVPLSSPDYGERTNAIKPLEGGSPYSPSMFAAAAAAHMHFLSAAAVAASFTSGGLPTSASTGSAVHAIEGSTKMHGNRVAKQGAASVNSIWQQPKSRLSWDSNMDSRTLQQQPAFPFSSLSSLNGSGPIAGIMKSQSTTSHQQHQQPNSKSTQNTKNAQRHYSWEAPYDGDAPESPGDASSEPGFCDGRGPRKLNVHRRKMHHIKKPLNAFMLFMKEMRPRVQEECTLKESAAINQILGKKWHELSRSEQTKYYEMARQAKELHQRLYPGWSARDNYAYHARRRRRRRPFHHFPHSNGTLPSPSSVPRTRSSSVDESASVNELRIKPLPRPRSASGVLFMKKQRTISGPVPKAAITPPPTLSQPQSIYVSPTSVEHPIRPSFMPNPTAFRRTMTEDRSRSGLTHSAYSAFEQHYQPQLTAAPSAQQQQPPAPLPQQLIYSSSRIHPPYGLSAGMRPSVMVSQPQWSGSGGYQLPVQRSPYGSLLNSGLVNNDSVAAVAAVAAMAAGELSSGNMKKCRARFGLEHQNLWCKPCRRKKKCIRFISENEIDDFMPSVFSLNHNHHPHSSMGSYVSSTGGTFSRHELANLMGAGGGGHSPFNSQSSFNNPSNLRNQSHLKSPFCFPPSFHRSSQQLPNSPPMAAYQAREGGYARLRRPPDFSNSSYSNGNYWESSQTPAKPWNEAGDTLDQPPRVSPMMTAAFAGSSAESSKRRTPTSSFEKTMSPPEASQGTLQQCHHQHKKQSEFQASLNYPFIQGQKMSPSSSKRPRDSNSTLGLGFGVADVMGFSKEKECKSNGQTNYLKLAAACVKAAVSWEEKKSSMELTVSPSTSSCPLRSSPELDTVL